MIYTSTTVPPVMEEPPEYTLIADDVVVFGTVKTKSRIGFDPLVMLLALYQLPLKIAAVVVTGPETDGVQFNAAVEPTATTVTMYEPRTRGKVIQLPRVVPENVKSEGKVLLMVDHDVVAVVYRSCALRVPRPSESVMMGLCSSISYVAHKSPRITPVADCP